MKTREKNIILFVGNIKKIHIESVEKVSKNFNYNFRIAVITDLDTIITLSSDCKKRLCYFKRCDAKNKEDIKEKLKDIKNEIVVVYFVFERYVRLYCDVLKIIKLKNNPPIKAIERSIDKMKMRRFFYKYDPSITPKFVQVKSKNDIKLISERIGFPCMLKPASLTRSRLVTVSDNAKELRINLNKTFKIIDKVYKREKIKFKPLVIAEEMMNGKMYTVDVYISDKQKVYFTPFVYIITGKNLGVNDFHNYARIITSDLSQNEIKKARLIAKKGVLALGMKNLTAHVELMRTKNGWKIIEIGPRIGGYRILMLDISYNIKHMENYILLRLNKKPVIKDKLKYYSAFLEIFPEKEGRIKSIKGINKIKKLNSFHYLEIRNKIGSMAGLSKDGYIHTVHVILKNKNKSNFFNDLKAVRSLVKIGIRKV